MPAGQRFAIWCLALLFTLPLWHKGRVPAKAAGGAAFSRLRPGTVTVRLAGDLPRPGVYQFREGTTVVDAIKMTLPKSPPAAAMAGGGAGRLACGDLVTLSRGSGRRLLYTVGRMPAKELMLLDIPLDVDLLRADEWESLPGIGPVLSARIAADRQNNGAFGSLEGLLRVTGVGEGKLAPLRRYFK
ncbi:MAG TPA: helix-hairpin-helix domain-containing protein [Geomonas sp.]|nr:helix-hairpin-helix domain-containing protein [Geomonas sp.]